MAMEVSIVKHRPLVVIACGCLYGAAIPSLWDEMAYQLLAIGAAMLIIAASVLMNAMSGRMACLYGRNAYGDGRTICGWKGPKQHRT